jgi:hypothetical protein
MRSFRTLLANTEEEKASGAHVAAPAVSFSRNSTTNRPLGHTIYLHYCDNFTYDGSKPNMSVEAILDQSLGYVYVWSGVMIARGCNKLLRPDRDAMRGGDLTAADIRPIADYLKFLNGYI